MEIRMATVKETLEILTYWKTVMEEATAGYLKTNQECEHTPPALFPYADFDYLVCMAEGAIRGWIGIGEIRDVFDQEAKGFISELYIHPSFREQGIGRILCQEAIKRLSEVGYPSVQLNVFKDNHARNLYEKLGFTEVSSLMELNFKKQKS